MLCNRCTWCAADVNAEDSLLRCGAASFVIIESMQVSSFARIGLKLKAQRPEVFGICSNVESIRDKDWLLCLSTDMK